MRSQIRTVRGSTFSFGVLAVITLIIFPPVGFWLCIAYYFLWKRDRRRVAGYHAAVRHVEEMREERERILAFKSLP